MATETKDAEMAVCACCRGAGILWVFGGPVVCPHCAGCGEDIAIERPLEVRPERMH